MQINKKKIFVLGVYNNYGYNHEIYFANSKDELKEYMLSIGKIESMYFTLYQCDIEDISIAKLPDEIRDDTITELIK